MDIITSTSNSTVVLGDLHKSTSSKISSIIPLLRTIDIDLDSQGALYTNTWGDAFVAVFDTAEKAVSFALKIRDNLRLHDWRSEDMRHTPLLRTALTSGQLNWVSYNNINDIKTPEGMPLVEVARIEPITNPGEVYVTNIVRELAGEMKFYFENIGQRSLPKDYGTLSLFRAYWGSEKDAISEGFLGPLIDDQYYRRAEALRRFTYLWLVLDQLPIGSWGRSVPGWMSEVWRDDPEIMTTPLMEDEGGFETTVLNLELLSHLIGQEAIVNNNGWRAIEYLQKRCGPKGFGTLGLAREGYSIEPHPRHTALVGWLLGSVYKNKTNELPELRKLFICSARALLGGNLKAITKEFEEDRNPLILYLASWHIANEIQSDEFSKLFSESEIKQMLNNWRNSSEILLNKAQKLKYEKGRPEILAKNRESIYPLTIPYGEFIRMEAYSILSSSVLVDTNMPKELLTRINQGIMFIIKEYLKEWENPKKRYTRDRLRPVHCGPKPYYANDLNARPDIGTAAMLLRVLRSKLIIQALWNGKLPEEARKARYLLSEDLVQLFDRYLCEPRVYSFTHPGMLAGVMVGDGNSLINDAILSCREVVTNLPPGELRDDTVDKVLSERTIERLVDSIVAIDGMEHGIQLASYSLTRLLVDKLRPGRYIREKLSNKGVKVISEQTLEVYTNPSFVEKYDMTWGYIPDLAIIAPFLRLIGKKSNILDVGCGPGQYALELTKDGHTVIIIDASIPMLDIASERLQKVTGNNPIRIKCDVLDSVSRANFINQNANAYDAIWCAGLFVHIPKEEQPEVLKWFYHLLRPEGYLFVNTILDNPRVFTRDGRYFGYIAEPRNFETILCKCGFQSEYVVQTKIKRNTYGEPFIETVWANYYAKKMPPYELINAMEGESNKACILTSLAYARSAEDYAKSHGVKYPKDVSQPDFAVTNNKRLKTIESCLEKLHGFLKDTTGPPCVLDAGCGPGDYVVQMALRGWKAVGVDMSEKTIQLARNNCPLQLRDRATFFICDMGTLPSIWSERFDAVLCVTAFQHIPVDGRHASRVLNEFARVLRPNGILRIDVQIGRETGYDPDLRFIQGYKDREEIISFMELAGFTIIETNEWELEPGKNTYQRPIAFKFIELWGRKKQ